MLTETEYLVVSEVSERFSQRLNFMLNNRWVMVGNISTTTINDRVYVTVLLAREKEWVEDDISS